MSTKNNYISYESYQKFLDQWSKKAENKCIIEKFNLNDHEMQKYLKNIRSCVIED